MRSFILIAALMFSVNSYSGWSSGGGELIGDTQNPWFVKNTKEIKYCVEIDEANFGQTRAISEQRIENAIQYWKKEFAGHSLNLQLKVASQSFVKGSCSTDTGLRFQFGVLTEEQKEKMGDISRIIGVAVRTDYDKENLRGKGFIYIAPSRGPLKIESEEIVAEPWAQYDGELLELILIHEMGHVFGLPHITGSALMAADSVESILNNKSWEFGLALYKAINPGFFKFKESSYPWEFCWGPVKKPKILEPFFGIQGDYNCLGYGVVDGKFILRAGKDETVKVNTVRVSANVQRLPIVGTAELSSDSRVIDGGGVTLWLPPEQKVYEENSLMSQRWIFGPTVQILEKKATYNSSNKMVTRKIFLTLEPINISRIGGIYNEEIILDALQGN